MANGFETPGFNYANAFDNFEGFSGVPDQRPWYSKFGDSMKENPEKFAILADMMGSAIAPENAFAGVATKYGQSSLANKARKEQQQQQMDWQKLVGSLISGVDMRGMTPQGTPGRSEIKIQPGAEDSEVDKITTTFDIPSLGKKKSGEYMNMGEMMQGPF